MVRYLHPTDRNPRSVRKINKLYEDKLDFKNMKFPVKTRDIYKFERKRSIDLGTFGYEDKEKYPIYVSQKCCKDKHVDLLLVAKGEKKHYVLMKDFNTFTYDHTVHRGRKHFCRYCFQAFKTAETLKRHIIDCFQINGKQRISCLERVNTSNSKIMREK